jgi:hypothetical protein
MASQGEARLGAAGVSRCDMVCHGLVCCGRRVTDRLGTARSVMSRFGASWFGRFGGACRGRVWRGMPGFGKAGRGRQDMMCRGLSWFGKARFGRLGGMRLVEAGQGEVGHGKSRYGRHGKAGLGANLVGRRHGLLRQAG